jgi:SAM-dependent methyltransferase
MTGLSHLEADVRPAATLRTGTSQRPGPLAGKPMSIRDFPQSPAGSLSTVLSNLPLGARVLDIGCQGWTVVHRAESLERMDLRHYGCDLDEGTGVIHGEFRRADLCREPLPWEDDQFDCVVMSHVLEHLTNPHEVLGEAVRVCRPGGTIFVETPSDRSVRWSFPWAQHLHLILSYWDDPTHVGRPFTPQALYRMSIYWSCIPLVTRYDQRLIDMVLLPLLLLKALVTRDVDSGIAAWWRATGWCCYGVFSKRQDVSGKPPMNYFSFKGVRARTLDIGQG